MALLSTFRLLGTRLCDNIWWLLSFLPAPREKQTTLAQLNDDCLLLILENLSVPELFQLRPVCRRLCHLVERYRLPQYKTLLFGYSPTERKQRKDVHNEGQQVEVYLSTHHYLYRDFTQRTGLSRPSYDAFYSRPRQLFSLKLSAFPPNLPTFLPRLSTLTFSNYLVDEEEPLTDEQVGVNQILRHYLRSSWSNTLVSLHLYLQVPAEPQPYYAFFQQINKLTALRHLFLEFTRFTQLWTLSLLPHSMPILGQVLSFSLLNYVGHNTARLLNQLNPNLTFLSLHNVCCQVTEFAQFLANKPTYGQTLKRIEVNLHDTLDSQLFTVCARHLLSLEHFIVNHRSPNLELAPFFSDLSRLSKLREIAYVPLYINKLRAFRLLHPLPGSLPRLFSIQRATIIIYQGEEGDFQPEELFDELLPILAVIFCGLEYLDISLSPGPASQCSQPLSLQLLNRVNQLFKRLGHCIAAYNILPQE